MTGLELIVVALAAGAAAGITDTSSSAIRDGYAGLREALRRRLASRGRGQAVRILDAEETEPEVWRERLGKDLAECGADRDEQILTAADHLLALLDPAGVPTGTYRVDLRGARGVQVGDNNIQHNTFS